MSDYIEEAATLDDFISEGDILEFKLSNFVLSTVSSNIAMPMFNIFTEYIEILKAYRKYVTLTDEEYIKYNMNPHRLAYDVYKTNHMWSILLLINDMVSVTEFNTKNIYLLDSDGVAIVNKIIVNEEDNVDENKDEYGI